jgi:NiFe hydrogenase small subunit HydA
LNLAGEWIMGFVNTTDFATDTVHNPGGYAGALGGLTRREFLTYCTGIAATLGLSSMMGLRIAEAATAPQRPPVIWLSAQECTGCTESLLRAYHPTLETLILDMISLDYHEALCAGAGHQAEAFKVEINEGELGQSILVVDGSIPTKDGGVYCMVAGTADSANCSAKRRKGRRRSSASVPALPGAAFPPAIPIRPAPNRFRRCCQARPSSTFPVARPIPTTFCPPCSTC